MSFDSDESSANRAAKAVLLIRILVGSVFLSEGIQKFLFPDSLGVGRFVKIGIPWPQVMAPFVSVVEIVCGALLLIGLMTLTRASAWLGSWAGAIMGLLYGKSIPALVLFSVVLQLLALPLLAFANREKAVE
jgi:uncharacterized membrane protein YphA (DoxX/SURF4 family)